MWCWPIVFGAVKILITKQIRNKEEKLNVAYNTYYTRTHTHARSEKCIIYIK